MLIQNYAFIVGIPFLFVYETYDVETSLDLLKVRDVNNVIINSQNVSSGFVVIDSHKC